MKRPILILLTFLIVLASCGKPTGFRIGSKNFTEQTVLAELIAQRVESQLGMPVDRRTNLGGTLICHEAVRTGEIDLYVEYTGTALTTVLHAAPSSDPADVLRRVREGYDRQFGLEIADPLGFDNSFAMVIRGDDARGLNVHTLTDLAAVAPKWRAGFGYEFVERPDGYPGLARIYGLKFAEEPRLMDLGLLYRALEEKQVDIVAGSATDGIISARDFVVLTDDKHYFPPYEAVPVVNRKSFERYPALKAILKEMAGRITAEDMRQLNYAVDGQHHDVKEVVRDFLAAKKL